MPPKNDHWLPKGERPTPKGLTGKELGMYYREKQVEKRRQQNSETQDDEHGRHPKGLTGREIGQYYRKKQLEKRNQQNFGHHETQDGEGSSQVSRWCKNRNSIERNQQSLNPLNRDKIEIDKDSLQEILTSISRHSRSDSDIDTAGTSSASGGLLKSYQQNLQRNSTSDGKLLFDGPPDEIWPVGECISMEHGEEYNRQRSQPEKSKLYSFRKTLPAFKKQHEIMQLINDHPVVVIDGDTGCGK